MISKKMMDEIVAEVAWLMPGARQEQQQGVDSIIVPQSFGYQHKFTLHENDSWTWLVQSRATPRSNWKTITWCEVSLTGNPLEIAERMVYEYVIEDLATDEQLRKNRRRWFLKQGMKEVAAA